MSQEYENNTATKQEIAMTAKVATLLFRPLTNRHAAMIEDVLGVISLFLLLFLGLGLSGPF